MKVIIDLRKSVEENAAFFFEKAKKAKRKLEGIEQAVRRFRDLEAGLLSEQEFALVEEKRLQEKVVRKREWFEKFHWFLSSDGLLCLGGRDAVSNDVLVKKHVEKGDVVFHTEAPGSPFFVVKSGGQKIGDVTIEEAGQATAVYSRDWKRGVAASEVYWVLPEQVSKQAMAGEFLGRGAFMISGRRNYLRPVMKASVGVLGDGRVMGGPVSAVKKHCQKFVLIIQGDEKVSSAAKKIAKILGTDDIDGVVAALPVGGVKVIKE